METLRRPFRTPSFRTRRRATSLGTSLLTTIESPDSPSTLRRMLAHVRHAVSFNGRDHLEPPVVEEKSTAMAELATPAEPAPGAAYVIMMEAEVETKKESAAEGAVQTSAEAVPDPKPAEETCHCSICSDEHPRSALVNPCKTDDKCLWCGECLERAFVSAANDEESMPPKCHTIIQLHYALPHLSQENAAKYRKTFDVWSTSKRIYCPVPICSAFIPPRFFDALDEQDRTTASQLHCPECTTVLCHSCHDIAHGDQPCAEDSVDAETLAALARWGYKRCPKCKEGVRRMYGCTHMRCRCGVSWCWNCQRAIDECERSQCDYEDEVADDDDDYSDSQSEDGLLETLEAGAELPNLFSPTDPRDEAPEGLLEPAPEPARRLRRQRSNLDARPAHYWESQDLDFGDEPNAGIADGVWCCEHSWEPYNSRKEKNKVESVECHRCWKVCQPADLAGAPEAAARQCDGCWVVYCAACTDRCTSKADVTHL